MGTFYKIALLTLSFASTAVFAQQTSSSSASTLDKIKNTGVVHVGYRESSVPFSYWVGENEPTGFAWEICGKVLNQIKKVTGRTDLKVVPQLVTSQNRISLLQNGTVDLECGSTTNNAERAKQVAFSINYFYSGTRFLVKSNSGIKGIEDLKGKRVVSTTGTTNFSLLRKLNTERALGFELLATKEHAEASALVFQGRADAFGMDDVLLYGARALAANPNDWAVVGEAFNVDPYAIMMRRDDPALKKLVDEVLSSLMKSGDFEVLYKKWFQSPIPPKGINLNLPMSKELQDNLKNLSDKPAI